MALVKKSTLGTRKRPSVSDEGAPSETPAAITKRTPVRRASADRAVTVVERIDQATEELASGLAEASAASTELQQSMTRIASGAEEAAGAAQESLGSVGALGKAFESARERAEASQRRAEGVRQPALSRPSPRRPTGRSRIRAKDQRRAWPSSRRPCAGSRMPRPRRAVHRPKKTN